MKKNLCVYKMIDDGMPILFDDTLFPEIMAPFKCKNSWRYFVRVSDKRVRNWIKLKCKPYTKQIFSEEDNLLQGTIQNKWRASGESVCWVLQKPCRCSSKRSSLSWTIIYTKWNFQLLPNSVVYCTWGLYTRKPEKVSSCSFLLNFLCVGIFPQYS